MADPSRCDGMTLRTGDFPVTNRDRYELLRRLSQGGMGTVYQGRDRQLGRIVALNFIRGDDELHRDIKRAKGREENLRLFLSRSPFPC